MADSPRRAALAAAALALAVGLYGAHLRRAQPEPIGPHPWFDSAPRLPAEAAEADRRAIRAMTAPCVPCDGHAIPSRAPQAGHTARGS